MKKGGDFNLSFSMIFSIIVIIAIVAVAFYVIIRFVWTSECTEIGVFYESLEKDVEKAWSATIHGGVVSYSLPSRIKYVCFGSLNGVSTADSKEIQSELYRYFINEPNSNVFLYPVQEACDSYLSSFELKHAKIDGFFCVEVRNGKIKIKTEKSEYDSLVSVSLP